MFNAFVRGIRLGINAVIASAAVFFLIAVFSGLQASAADDVVGALTPTLQSEPVTTTVVPVSTDAAAAVVTPAYPWMQPGIKSMMPIPDAPAPGAFEDPRDAKTSDGGGQSEMHCLATAIYFEARGESIKGQKAVGEVILARTHVPGRPTTICGVVYEGSERKTGCQFSFTCDHIPDVVRTERLWLRAERVARTVMRTRGRGRIVRGATFYHADYVNPAWASGMVRVAQIGSHIFYRPKRGRLF
jgi:hypothetical protein